jgi:hypothetical protein
MPPVREMPRCKITLDTIGPVEEPMLDESIMSRLAESYALRNFAYDELQKYDITRSLIEAARQFRPHAPISWVTETGAPATPNDVKLQPVVTRGKSSEEADRFTSDLSHRLERLSQPPLPKTAGDALAEYLRPILARAKRANGSPVRVGKTLPSSSIARIAVDMLANYAFFGHAPGPGLVELIRELLDADKRKLKSDRQFESRSKAAWILALNPSVATRPLARLLRVEPSSVSRWRRDLPFNKLIQQKKESFVNFKKRRRCFARNKANFINDLKKLLELREAWATLTASMHDISRKSEKEQIEEVLKHMEDLTQLRPFLPSQFYRR